jgi:uncharacterized membrane-anchored protein
MNQKNKIKTFLFVLLILVQLGYLGDKLFQYINVYSKGKTFLFELRAKDPADMFRGKYMELNFVANKGYIPDSLDVTSGAKVWARLSKDVKGMAQVEQIYFQKPKKNENVVQAVVYFPDQMNGHKVLVLKYPFNRFYLNEFNIDQLEQEMNSMHDDSIHTSYAKVKVWNGRGIVESLMINGKIIE